jgi:mannosyl-3-phosphoglycerate phosphatase
MMNKNFIVFTDLDGTLLDAGYSFKRALPAMRMLKEYRVPLILCSSKTKVEVEHCRKKIGNKHPFISENGGGIFIPKKLKSRIQNLKYKFEKDENYYIIKLGAAYGDLRNALDGLRNEGFDLRGFGDMSVKEVAGLTGLKISDARMARNRDFDEPFVFSGDKKNEAKLKRRIKAKGFIYTKGEFCHIIGNSDKGRAVEIVKKLYKIEDCKLITIALGDSPNDIEMLQRVDYPVVVKKESGRYHPEVLRKVKKCIRAGGIGPEGWNRAVIKLISNFK